MFKNIFYVGKLWEIGGTETFLYYLCKKYKDYDICVVYEIGDKKQIERLNKYVPTIKWEGQKLKCEKAFYNYNPNIIDYIEADEHIQILHTDYGKVGLKPSFHPKITKYIGVTKYVCESVKKDFGIDVELCYNPLAVDEARKILRLCSATRLTWEKGKKRMEKLCTILREADIPYEWHIFTNDTNAINQPNVYYHPTRLDISDYIKNCDYLVQLSDNLERLSVIQ